jgi:hypothetical protein
MSRSSLSASGSGQMRADRVVYRFKFLSYLLVVDNTEFFQRKTKCWKSQEKLEEVLSDIS